MTNFRFLFVVCFMLLGVVPLQPVTAQTTPQTKPSAQASVFLPLVNGTAASNQTQTSNELIAAAERAGTISSETALVYYTYVMFGDTRLPTQFRGADEDHGHDGTSLMTEIVFRWKNLSAKTQALLKPFTLRPTDPESWFAQHTDAQTRADVRPSAATIEWETIDVAGAPVKFWYHVDRPADAARARVLAAELNQTIWPKLTTLMREPLLDCGATCEHGGGDNRLDIYMVGEPVDRSYVKAETGSASSTYMVLRRNVPFSVLAHELMHTIQFAYPLYDSWEYLWSMEATAEWAIHYVYPKHTNDPSYPETDPEHYIAYSYLMSTFKSLEERNDAREYGAYLYFLFLNNPQVVKLFWEKSTYPSSLKALNEATPGGITAVWPQFMVANWNRDNITRYAELDAMLYGAAISETLRLEAQERKEYQSFELSHLSGNFLVASFSNDARLITFENPLADSTVAGGQLWVIPTIDGKPRQPENWTSFSRKRFCRDLPGQNLSSMILVVSNTEWQDHSTPLTVDGLALTTKPACDGALTGTVTYEAKQTFNSSDTTGSSELRTSQTLVMQVRLRYDGDLSQYVDDGSTYSLTGSHYDTSQASAPGSVRSTFEWTESGGGALEDQVGAYIDRGPNGDGPRRLMLSVDGVPYQINGTVTYTPPGYSVPVERDETVSPTCNDYNDLPSQPTKADLPTFDMTCTQTITSNAGSSTVKVTGTLGFS